MSFHPNYNFEPGGESSSSPNNGSSSQGQMHSMAAMAAMSQANMMAASHFSSMGGMTPYFAQHQAHMQQQQQQQAQAQLQQQQQQLQAQHQQYMQQMYSAGNTNDLLSAHHAAAAAAGGWLAAAHHSPFQPAASRLHPSISQFAAAAAGGHASSPHLAAAAAAISDGMAAVAESTKKAAVTATATTSSTSSSSTTTTTSSSTTTTPSVAKKRKPYTKRPGPSEIRVKKFKTVKELVVNLMQYCQDEFPDRHFAQRALLNLARKVSPNKELMTMWARSIISKSPKTPCISIPRPKEGRLTIARSASGGTKKVYPQVFLCQVFRWPRIVFYSDIRCSDECQTKAPIRWLPPKDESGKILDLKPKDNICINPYHYTVAPEAEARFKKHRNKARRAARLKTKMAAANKAAAKNNTSSQSTTAAASTSSSSQNHESAAVGNSLNSVASSSNDATVASPSTSAHNRPPPVASSSETVDEGFSDGEEEQQDSAEDEGDYVAKWNNKAVLPDQHAVKEEKPSFDPKKLMDEIKFLDQRKAENGEDLSEKFRLEEGVKAIVQGEYLDPDHPYRRALAKQQQSLRSVSSPEVLQGISKTTSQNVQINKSSSVPDLRPTSSSTSQSAQGGQSSQGVAPMAKGSEDPCIADLLDDIRGSFERQFDGDAFEDIQTSNNQHTTNASSTSGASSTAFPGMHPSFDMDGAIRSGAQGNARSSNARSGSSHQFFNDSSPSRGEQQWPSEASNTTSRTHVFINQAGNNEEQQQRPNSSSYSSSYFGSAASGRNASVFNQQEEQQQQPQEETSQRNYSGLVAQSSFSHPSPFDGNNCTGYPAAHGHS